MSIINDALKKVQQSLSQQNQKTPTTNAPATPVSENPQEKPKAISPFDQPAAVINPPTAAPTLEQPKQNIWLAVLIMTVILIIAAVAVWFQIKDMPDVKEWVAVNRAKAKRATMQKASANQPVKPLAEVAIAPTQPAVENTASTAPTAPVIETKPTVPLTLKIHGVMANGATNIALINDQVYQEGDTVQGVKILKINMDKIVVLNNGKEETVSVGK